MKLTFESNLLFYRSQDVSHFTRMTRDPSLIVTSLMTNLYSICGCVSRVLIIAKK